ncbi:MAG TPA: OmpA family protein, partial [Desulfosalsimonadaceae bacterium]|nr:OmpA family protein [Desulfosalsimonadaceae bacterium]
MKDQRLGLYVGLVLVIVSLIFMVSCAKHRDVSETAGGESREAVEKAGEKAGEAGEAGEAAISEEELAARKKAEARQAKEKAAKEKFVNENVYFGFDDASLTRKARRILSDKAEWLRDHPEQEVVIEGHCDERGTKEYNMALGQRRAESIKNYLVNAGIDSSRIDTISYGEERPVDPRHN